MPTVNVVERKVSPKLDQGLIAGLIAGAVVFGWMFLIGALSDGGAWSYPAQLSALAEGSKAYDNIGLNFYWLVGALIHFAAFALLGVLFAAVWPRLRANGTWAPSILFMLGAYLVLFQILGRIIEPDLPKNLNDFGLVTGFFFAGIAFAWRYRRA